MKENKISRKRNVYNDDARSFRRKCREYLAAINVRTVSFACAAKQARPRYVLMTKRESPPNDIWSAIAFSARTQLTIVCQSPAVRIAWQLTWIFLFKVNDFEVLLPCNSTDAKILLIAQMIEMRHK